MISFTIPFTFKLQCIVINFFLNNQLDALIIQLYSVISWYSDCLRAGRFGDRIPVGSRFSAPFQTGPKAHPAFCTMGTGSFPGGKLRPGRDADPSSLLVQRSKIE